MEEQLDLIEYIKGLEQKDGNSNQCTDKSTG